MPRHRAGMLMAASAIVAAAFIMLGLFVYADRAGLGEGESAALTEKTLP